MILACQLRIFIVTCGWLWKRSQKNLSKGNCYVKSTRVVLILLLAQDHQALVNFFSSPNILDCLSQFTVSTTFWRVLSNNTFLLKKKTPIGIIHRHIISFYSEIFTGTKNRFLMEIYRFSILESLETLRTFFECYHSSLFYLRRFFI